MHLEDLLQAIDRITEYIEGYSFIDFEKDLRTVDAVIRNLEVIAKTSYQLSHKLDDKYPLFSFLEISLLTFQDLDEYFEVDYQYIWNIATRYLPGSKIQVAEILEIENKRTKA